MFMQLSVMMMLSGQSTWETTRRRRRENRGASECERKWNRMGEVGDKRRQKRWEGGGVWEGVRGRGERTVTKEVEGKEGKSFQRAASV